MNAIIKTQLQQYFSDRQIGAWLKLKSDNELNALCVTLTELDSPGIKKLKAQLGATYRQQLARRPRRKHSTFGRLILSMKDGDK